MRSLECQCQKFQDSARETCSASEMELYSNHQEVRMAWEVEFITETSYSIKRYDTSVRANRAADEWLSEQHPSVDPKVWVRPARFVDNIVYRIA